ncbi:sphingomyelin synthase-related protein 1-like [Liolophura sinensis]|uniref:sphingomyelin synthase-related protein 1-like n=1 Tax=Liolophura sinensis TaxID=3198878 RepID=UPI0031582EC7
MCEAPTWDCDRVGRWLEENNFQAYRQLFCTDHKIDGKSLLMLTESDLRHPPLQIQVLGDIKRLMICLHKLQQLNANFLKDVGFTGFTNGSVKSSSDKVKHRPLQNPKRAVSRLDSVGSLTESDSHHEDVDVDIHEVQLVNSTAGRPSRDLDPELWKTFLSFVYVFTVFLITAFVMVVVHDRVPDMQKYPPLPDLFLDNMPLVPWAFQMCELIGVVLSGICFGILFFHKHRFILMRRLFSILGTVFLLRSITMLLTSLSVPGVHLQCAGKVYGDIWSKIERTLVIWKGFGMSLQGVRSCGDYMFSGHTSMITLMNFFITEYTPRGRMYYLHTLSWVLNLFGIFFVLSAHEHYSIDVFIAFYITTRLFLYYHTLANNRALMQRDRKRTRIYFPLFAFFESKCDGVVPNEYEWPLKIPRSLKMRLYAKTWKKSS